MAARAKLCFFGNPALRKKAVRVDKIDDTIRDLADRMIETMHAENGVGLAAEQIGHSEAICVIDIPKPEEGKPETAASLMGGATTPMPVVMVNPQIIALSGDETLHDEGCLSFPEIFVKIRRPSRATVAYTDLAGKSQTVEAGGLFGRAIQHEVDHLNGVLLVDRMTPMQRLAMRTKLKKLEKQASTKKG